MTFYFSCWLSGGAQIGSVIVPIAVILAANIAIFFFIIKDFLVCFGGSDENNLSTHKKRFLTITVTCFSNMGIAWIFGFLVTIQTETSIKIVFETIFCVFNSLQGFLVCLAYLVLARIIRRV